MKQYNGEKAIISLTSWKARINTVGLTLFSLYKKCPGFHIVLVLSEEEFPKKEAELPDSVMAFVDQDLIEILWVYKNIKSFKKILPTMEKYKSVPIISADDDCVYRYNYADELYQVWLKNKKTCCSFWSSPYKKTNYYNTSGYATLYPPNYFGEILNKINDDVVKFTEDDLLYVSLRIIRNLRGCTCLNKKYNEVVFPHNEIKPLHDTYKKRTTIERDKLIDKLVSLLRKI